MTSFRITLKDRSTEEIPGVDAYQQEGQMTTFFRLSPGRRVVDAWSERVASFRTSEIVAIRRVEDLAHPRPDLLADALPEAPGEAGVGGRIALRSA